MLLNRVNLIVNANLSGTPVSTKMKNTQEKEGCWCWCWKIMKGCMGSADCPDGQYPDQPVFESHKQLQLGYGYERVKVQDGPNYRSYRGSNGKEKVRWDTSIEIRSGGFEEVRHNDTAPYDPSADGQDACGLFFTAEDNA